MSSIWKNTEYIKWALTANIPPGLFKVRETNVDGYATWRDGALGYSFEIFENKKKVADYSWDNQGSGHTLLLLDGRSFARPLDVGYDQFYNGEKLSLNAEKFLWYILHEAPVVTNQKN